LRSPFELLLEPPMESEMLPDEAEPALDAEEATLSACGQDTSGGGQRQGERTGEIREGHCKIFLKRIG
jgi:hypothetical protein